MKLATQKNKLKTPIILTLVAIVLLVAGSFAYVYAFNGSIFGWSATSEENSSQNIDTNAPSDEEIDAGQGIKEDVVNNDQEGKPSQDNTGNAPVLSASITAANQTSDQLQIRTLIESVVTGGTCTLTVAMGETEINQSANIQALANASTCMGFDVPRSSLSPGTWTITITINTPNGNVTLTNEVTIT